MDIKSYLFKLKSKLVIGLGLFLFISNANAFVLLTNTVGGISYTNPALLFQVPDWRFTGGAQYLFGDWVFNGRVRTSVFAESLGVPAIDRTGGPISDRGYSVFPYFEVAKRWNQNLVVGMSFDKLANGYTNWEGPDSFVNFIRTRFEQDLSSWSPRLSLMIMPQLFFGGAINFTRAELAYESRGPLGYVNDRAKDWATSFTVGASYMFNQTTVLSLAYFSKMHLKLKGPSTYGTTFNDTFFDLNVPSNIILDFMMFFSPQFFSLTKIIYTLATQGNVTRLGDATTGGAILEVRSNFRNPITFSETFGFVLTPRLTWLIGASYTNNQARPEDRDMVSMIARYAAFSTGVLFALTPKIKIQAGGGYLTNLSSETIAHDKIDYRAHGTYRGRFVAFGAGLIVES